MRIILAVAAVLLAENTSQASEIREFNVKTLERLGNELTNVSQRSDRGATDAVRKRAIETAKTGLRGRLFKLHYNYAILDDPDGSGFLVYALGQPPKRGDTVLSGHFRVTVSADATKVERIDGLSHSVLIEEASHPGLPKGTTFTGDFMTQIVSNTPVETIVYESNISGAPIFVGTREGKVWQVANGRMWIDKSKPGNETMGAAAKAAMKRLQQQ